MVWILKWIEFVLTAISCLTIVTAQIKDRPAGRTCNTARVGRGKAEWQVNTIEFSRAWAPAWLVPAHHERQSLFSYSSREPQRTYRVADFWRRISRLHFITLARTYSQGYTTLWETELQPFRELSCLMGDAFLASRNCFTLVMGEDISIFSVSSGIPDQTPPPFPVFFFKEET